MTMERSGLKLTTLLVAAFSLAFIQVASIPVWEEDKLSSVDLRQTGCVHQIEDEGSCGASYAYVTMALSAYHECMSKKPAGMAKGKVERYHARFVTDCGSSYSEHIAGCRGGFVTKALDFVRENGLPLFDDYKSVKKAGDASDKCPVPIPEDNYGVQNWQLKLQPMESLKKTKLVKLKLAEIHDHLSKHGPVVANLQLWPNYNSYKGEVFESIHDVVFQSHSMMIVGFGYNKDSRAYYTLWNSEGTKWGDKGYLNILEYSLQLHHISFYGLVSE